MPLVEQALKEAGISQQEVDVIAYTKVGTGSRTNALSAKSRGGQEALLGAQGGAVKRRGGIIVVIGGQTANIGGR